MFSEQLKKVVEEDILSKEVAGKYLSVYLGLPENDWSAHINTLYGLLGKRYGGDPTIVRTQLRQAISCAILLPVVDRSTYIDRENPQNLLFKCVTFHQFNERDWFDLLKKEIKRDLEISNFRDQAMALGIIDPIDYAPLTRQAFNWLYAAAEQKGDITPVNKDNIELRFKNLIWAYGGINVCNMFSRYNDWLKKKVVNWRSGYFFERGLFEHYTLEQVLKIKSAELDKTNIQLIKKIA